jgi:hypothetical protein
MRITGRQLRQIIKEEVSRMMNEAEGDLMSSVRDIHEALAEADGTPGARNAEGVYNDLKNIIEGRGNPRVMQTVKTMLSSTDSLDVVGVKFVARMAGFNGEVSARQFSATPGIQYNGDLIGNAGLTGARSYITAAGSVIGAALENAVG